MATTAHGCARIIMIHRMVQWSDYGWPRVANNVGTPVSEHRADVQQVPWQLANTVDMIAGGKAKCKVQSIAALSIGKLLNSSEETHRQHLALRIYYIFNRRRQLADTASPQQEIACAQDSELVMQPSEL